MDIENSAADLDPTQSGQLLGTLWARGATLDQLSKLQEYVKAPPYPPIHFLDLHAAITGGIGRKREMAVRMLCNLRTLDHYFEYIRDPEFLQAFIDGASAESDAKVKAMLESPDKSELY